MQSPKINKSDKLQVPDEDIYYQSRVSTRPETPLDVSAQNSMTSQDAYSSHISSLQLSRSSRKHQKSVQFVGMDYTNDDVYKEWVNLDKSIENNKVLIARARDPVQNKSDITCLVKSQFKKTKFVPMHPPHAGHEFYRLEQKGLSRKDLWNGLPPTWWKGSRLEWKAL